MKVYLNESILSFWPALKGHLKCDLWWTWCLLTLVLLLLWLVDPAASANRKAMGKLIGKSQCSVKVWINCSDSYFSQWKVNVILWKMSYHDLKSVTLFVFWIFQIQFSNIFDQTNLFYLHSCATCSFLEHLLFILGAVSASPPPSSSASSSTSASCSSSVLGERRPRGINMVLCLITIQLHFRTG